MIRLESVCEENFNQVIDLKRGTDVADFVDEPIYSLAEALLYKESSECFAICKGDLVVGFVSIYFGEENCQIINFLLDKDFRGRGYGARRQGSPSIISKRIFRRREFLFRFTRRISVRKSFGRDSDLKSRKQKRTDMFL